MNNNILRNMSYGVYIVSTMDGNRATGCVANSTMQITSLPATIAVSINHDNFTNKCIREFGKFSVSILAEDSNPALIGQFGFQSGKDNNKFLDVDFDIVEGTPVINDSCGYIVCKVIDKMETETHTVFLGEMIGAEVLGKDRKEMTYAYYHNVIKGKSPKSAPTYIPEADDAGSSAKEDEKKKDSSEKTKKDKKTFRCKVCGYEYVGEELPPDFICPLCKQGADKFEEV